MKLHLKDTKFPIRLSQKLRKYLWSESNKFKNIYRIVDVGVKSGANSVDGI